MPLEIYQFRGHWWARGHVEANGLRISTYYRQSTRAATEEGAREWVKREEARVLRQHFAGAEKPQLTFAEAVLLYPAKPREAAWLLPVLDHIGDTPLRDISPQTIRDLAPKLFPEASTATWKRQVIAPISAVINRAHQLGHCAPIRVKGWSKAEQIAQDRARGSSGRRPGRPGDWAWIDAFQAKADPYNAALVEFMFETGCRIGQALAITPKDLDLEGRQIWVQAQKGHEAQWVMISAEMAERLRGLKARNPHDKKNRRRLAARVFGYSSRSAVRKAWLRICAEAGIDYRSPHAAGRHGFYTELRVRQNVPAHVAAKAGRWAGTALPERTYAHADGSEAELRARMRISRVYGAAREAAKDQKQQAKS